MGVNLLPDNPSSQEQATFNQRETVRQISEIKNALPGLVTGALTITAGSLAKTLQTSIKSGTTPGQIVAAEATLKLNNFYRDGASPEIIQKTYNQAAESSTHNVTSNEVILGKYIAGSDNSYEAVAQARGSTYFSMSDWSTVEGQLGSKNMWNINEAFLDKQISQGKTFVFTVNPTTVDPSSFTAQEFNHLRLNGYSLQVINGEFHVTK